MEEHQYNRLIKAITLLSVEVETLRNELKEAKESKANTEYMTLKEVSEYTKIAEDWIKKMAYDEKEIPVYIISRKQKIYRRADIDRWILKKKYENT